MVTSKQVSRRRFVGGTALAVALPGLAGACGGVTDSNQRSSRASARHRREAIDELDFSNWPLYVNRASLDDFEHRYGAQVNYVEDINDNDEYLAKVRPALQRGQSIERDLVVPTDSFVARWIRQGLAEPIDKRNVPNLAHLDPNLRHPRFDPGRRYSVPWQTLLTGLAYNQERTGRPITSVADIFDPKFKGRVSVFSNPYDTLGLLVLGAGVQTEDATLDDVLTALEQLELAWNDGQIRRFTGDDYTADLTSGNTWIAFAYSASVRQLARDNASLRFVIPEEGGLQAADNLLMPSTVEHPYAAETFMNFVYEPEVAAKLTVGIEAVSPVVGVRDLVARINPRLAEDELVFPSDEIRGRLHPFIYLEPDEERRMIEEMQRIANT